MPKSARDGTDTPPRLGVVTAGALVVGSMVGTGVFTTSGFLLELLGSRSAVLITWALGGAVALCGAMVYAELGAMIPRVGGEYAYLSRAFPPVVGFVSGWIALLAGFAAPIAAGSVAFGRYLESAGVQLPWPVAGPALIMAVTLLHARDVLWAGRLQVALTAANLAAVVVLVIAGGATMLLGSAAAESPAGVSPAAMAGVSLPSPSLASMAVALVIVSYSYFGWNAAAYVAGEIRDPRRALPWALVGGTALVSGLYLALNAVFLSALPPQALAGRLEVAERAATALWGAGAGKTLSLIIAAILAASVSALVMTGPRVYLAMAEDGLFLRAFARRNARGAPWAGVLLQGLTALFFAATATFDGLLVYIGFTLSLSAAATVLAAVWLRRREPLALRPFRVPGWPLPALLFVAACAWMTAHSVSSRPRESVAGAATVLSGALAYWWWRGRGPRRGAPR